VNTKRVRHLLEIRLHDLTCSEYKASSLPKYYSRHIVILPGALRLEARDQIEKRVVIQNLY
jgi:hypothetical protein